MHYFLQRIYIRNEKRYYFKIYEFDIFYFCFWVFLSFIFKNDLKVGFLNDLKIKRFCLIFLISDITALEIKSDF